MTRITERAATGVMEVFNTSTDASLATMVGSRYDSSDNREFVIVQSGGTALAAGKLSAGVAPTTNHTGLTTTAFTAYSANGNQPAQVTVTLGATLVNANEYAGGYAVVASGTGIGQTLKIASHPSAALSASVVITLEDSPAVALDTTSVIDLLRNPYGSSNGTNTSTNGVVVAPTSFAGQVIGASFYAIPASTSTVPTYGLIQTSGPVALTASATVNVGTPVSPSTGTAGNITTAALSGSALTTAIVGYAIQAGTTGTAHMVHLQL